VFASAPKGAELSKALDSQAVFAFMPRLCGWGAFSVYLKAKRVILRIYDFGTLQPPFEGGFFNVKKWRKMMKERRFLILFLLAGMSFSVEANAQSSNAWQKNCPSGTTAGTDCWQCGDNCAAYLTDDTTNEGGNKQLNITGTGEMENFPENRAPWVNTREAITNIKITDGITSVGDYAFFQMTNVTNLTIPESVTHLGNGAFKSMTGVENLVIPDSVTTLGGFTFYGMKGIKNLSMSASITSFGDYPVYGFRPENFYCSGQMACSIYTYGSPKTNYTKDENTEIYSVTKDGVTTYYASPDAMMAQNSCGSDDNGNPSQQCFDDVLQYRHDRALAMAGGSRCKSEEDCFDLLTMASEKEVCFSIDDCKAYGYKNGMGFGYDYMIHNADGSYNVYDGNNKLLGYKNKRIYSVDEAQRISKKAGNKFRVRYK